MKKLVFLLCIIFTLSSTAQTSYVIKSYGNKIGYWNELTKQWKYEVIEYNQIHFLLSDGILYASDKDDSEYHLGHPLREFKGTSDILSYKNAIDDKGRNVYIGLMKNSDNFIIIVMYSNIVFDYYCTSPEIFEEDINN